MTSVGDEENDNVLSDVEGDDDNNNDPVSIDYKNLSKDDISVERFREVIEQLENEKKLRLAIENSKSELENKFGRLKAYAQDIIKKRDEFKRLREEEFKEKEEALRLNDKLSGELEEALRVKEDVLKQRDEIGRQLDEVSKARELMRSETETATQMLSSGIDKISGKVSNFKNFSAGGLPKSQRYTGLPGIAYGVIKRTHEIVEEIVKQYDGATKSRNDAREQMEQRNYEIAIEVSQLEATISGLREEVAKKTSDVENLDKLVAEKDGKIWEMDRESLEKQNMAEREVGELREVVNEYEHKLRSLESKVESQRPLLIDQVNYITKIHDQIHSIIKIVDATHSDQSDLADSLFIPPQEMDVNENLQASLDLMKSTSELVNIATEKIRVRMQDWTCETKGLNETVARLVKEKQHIGSLLRSALPKKMTFDPQSKTSEALFAAENGLREIGIDARFSNFLGNGKDTVLHDKQSSEEAGGDEAGALENIVKACQLEIIELQHSVDELRTESSLLKAHVEAQSKELSQKKHRIEELEEKERVANESVEGLMLDIAAAEEEIIRWKVAAEQEAAAGRAVEQEFIAKLSALQEELNEAKQAMLESEKKLKFKEETAAAAMSARDAAEKSLRLADMRASRLGERVEELSRHLEESDTREDSRNGNRQRYICWPWQWLGLNFVGYHLPETQQQGSNEMELSEPLL
ncbi:hypothetical protein AQUCO_05600027v1 [Aquilegia coerulea]|uniref:Uncharacterized protein n=1 Tax=Aquilegia coerulea TaxID=218851 RepID=A0A2G5CG60_AQUCA|nr:hypothetical protein AQUCO_05600027v1 [Aquilegia coerulea]